MNNTCPKCGTAYAVNPSVVGRTFTCKNCGSALVVAADGLTYKDRVPAAAPAPAPAPEPAGGAFNFDAPAARDDDEEDRPAKSAKKKKRPKRDDDEEENEQEKERGRKREREPEEEEEPPRRSASRRGSGGGFGEYLTFRQFIVPVVIQIVFWLLSGLAVLGGLGWTALAMMQGGAVNIIIALFGLLLSVPFTILLIRIYCEVILIMFRIYDRLGEIKEALQSGTDPNRSASDPNRPQL